MQGIINSDTKILREYAGFLKKNHLDELAGMELEIIGKMDIPLMKFFAHLSQEELKQLTIKGLEEFLTNVENDTLLEANAESLAKWERDELEGGISKHAIQPSDLVQIYGAQKLTLVKFIPRFTDKIEVAIEIMNALTSYYMGVQELAYDVLIKIRKEAELALKESEEKFRAVSQSANNAILIIDKKGKIIFWNKGAERMFNYSEEEALNKDFAMLLPDDTQNLIRQDLLEYWQTCQSDLVGQTTEITANRKNGNSFPVEISISSFETSRGKLVSAIVHDMTDSKNAARKLEDNARKMEESNKDLEQFAYIASHDMKEPLRMVTNYLQLLQKKNSEILDAESKEYIDYAIGGALRMRTLITDLLEYSRVNRSERDLEPVNLQETIDEVLVNLDAQIKEKNAEINIDKLPVIQSDKLQMVQLFQNLISNAIKFSDKEKPIVQVRVKPDEANNAWLFSIEDNGIGIDPQYADKVFQMFQRLHSTEDYPGTGIGLAICKKIVERFGGKIWFTSELGKGTTFFFTLKSQPV